MAALSGAEDWTFRRAPRLVASASWPGAGTGGFAGDIVDIPLDPVAGVAGGCASVGQAG